MKTLSFDEAKQQVAEKNGYPSWGSVVQNLVADAYITTLDRTKRDRKKFLEMEAGLYVYMLRLHEWRVR